MTATLETIQPAGDPFDDVRELFCSGCGYGIVARSDPPECPMCRGWAWSDHPSAARWN
ncbi:MAG TPA: hypothetical protein VFA05_05430 [Gaiellaceae bacterium]|nr:hypothetical protein [Gaiellaceae bacterium]